jgi:integrase
VAKSSESTSRVKVRKPYPEFPLTPHPSGRWCKKLRGKLCYFGKTSNDPNGTAAHELFKRNWPYLLDGRTPPPVDAPEDPDAFTVRELCNRFMQSKKAKLDSGELSPRTFADYFAICRALVDKLGKDKRVDDLRPEDFAALRSNLARTWGHVRLRNEINRARVVFKFASDERLIDRPVHFGQSFDRPSAKTIRVAKQAAGLKLFNVDEVKRILAAADPQIRAMVLLALNCGFGNSDCATLPQSALDLAAGWIDFPRPKTGIQRRIPLWPETVQALRQAIAARPEAKEPADAGLVFLTRTGVRWVRLQKNRKGTASVALDALSQRFAKLLDALGINGHRNFYTLRHNFETMAGESKDQVAVDAIMGHTDTTMAGVYRESISDARLLTVVDVVRAWVFPAEAAKVQ